MKRDSILCAIKTLAMSQGFYGRILRDLREIEENDPDRYEDIMQELEAQNFKTMLDIVYYFEC